MKHEKNWWKKISREFAIEEKNGISWAFAPRIKREGALHGITTRRGGASDKPPLDSLNLGWNRPDARENIEENYRRLADAAGFPQDSAILVNYQHGDGVERVDENDIGKGFGRGELPPCDALVTDSRLPTLFTLHADCMPVFIFDRVKKAGSMIHAGWKGTSMKIGAKAFSRLIAEYGSDPKDIIVAIGPSISQRHFEVDQDVYGIFKTGFVDLDDLFGVDGQEIVLKDDRRDKYFLDLWGIMALQLIASGADPENITVSDICTFEDVERFYSYRRDGKNCGAMAGFLRITG